ncbi:hypothetical protein ACX3T3_08340 [Actinotignum schaalii]
MRKKSGEIVTGATVIGLAMCLVSILVVTPLETRVVLARGRAND